MHLSKYDHIWYIYDIWYLIRIHEHYHWFSLKNTSETYLWSAKYILLIYNSILPFSAALYPVSHILNSLQRYRSLTSDMLGPWDISVRQEALSLNQIIKVDIGHVSICLPWTGVSFCQTWIIREVIGQSGAWTPAKRSGERVSLHEDEIPWEPFPIQWIRDHMFSKMRDEIIHPFPNFNGCVVEAFTPYFKGYDDLSMPGLKLIHMSKRDPGHQALTQSNWTISIWKIIHWKVSGIKSGHHQNESKSILYTVHIVSET